MAEIFLPVRPVFFILKPIGLGLTFTLTFKLGLLFTLRFKSFYPCLLKNNCNLLKNDKNILTNNIDTPYNTFRYQILLIRLKEMSLWSRKESSYLQSIC